MPPRTLVIETATTACSVALIEGGAVVAAIHEIVGRGHAERLVPMIAELPGGGRAERILVDCGPGSFTGIRVGIAAARGLGLGWKAPVAGYSSTALIAAAAFARVDLANLAVVMEGGHGEVFMQGFAASPLVVTDALASRTPAAARDALAGRQAFGTGVRWLRSDRADTALNEVFPNAADVILLPGALIELPPQPIYGRAPDATLPA